MKLASLACTALVFASMVAVANSQPCPEKNLYYYQAFPAGGESDIAARHQQLVLKKKCPGIETIIQYKPGAGVGIMLAKMNGLPGDGYKLCVIKLQHLVMKPL